MIKLMKIFALFMSVTLLISSSAADANAGLLSEENATISVEEDIVVTKDYTIFNGVDIKSNHIPTINEDFKDDRVIVTLKHGYSEIN